MVDERLYQITAPHYCAGIIIRGGRVIEAAPILRWTLEKSQTYILGYFDAKRYGVKWCKTESQR